MERQPSCCDFCGSPEALQDYLVGDETIAWYACPACTGLIEAENWDGLVERSLAAYADMRWIPEGEEAVVSKQVENLVLAFRAFRLVPA